MHRHLHGRFDSKKDGAQTKGRRTVRVDIQYNLSLMLWPTLLSRLRQLKDGWDNHSLLQQYAAVPSQFDSFV